VTQREESFRKHERFESGRDDGTNRPGEYTHQDVAEAQEHPITIRTTTEDVLDDEDALRAFGAAFARTLEPGDVVALRGDLGAGKTTFVRAVVAALHGSDDAVSSPTFVFRQRYDGTPLVEHLDLYRIDDAAAELPELGLDEAFADDRITFVEWPDRADGLLPSAAIEVAIAGSGPGSRRVRVRR